MGSTAINPIDKFFLRPVPEVAAELIGASLMFRGVGGLIVETEAYAAGDPASHSYNGPTARNGAMFGSQATVYIYRSYGIHWCLNLVCTAGSAVLIRALKPIDGIGLMQQRRGLADVLKLCSGPGRLCQALAITGEFDGHPVAVDPFQLRLPLEPLPVQASRRIGITKAAEVLWRFGLKGSPYVSRKL